MCIRDRVEAAGINVLGGDTPIGAGATIYDDGGVRFVGVCTATTFSGSGANLTSLPAANLTGTLPAISGANLTNLDASDLASGTVPTARLGSGTASSSTFLRGDSTFAAVTSTTINNNANNRIITGSGTANTLEGESGLTYDGSTLQVNGDGQFTGNDGTANQLKWDKSDDSLYFRDNVKSQFGTGGDLKIYHDATDDVIHSTGTSLRTRSNIFRANNAANSAVMFRSTAGGNFEAYYDGGKKFETVSAGVDISGRIQIDGHCFPYSNNAYDLGLSSNRWRNVFTHDLNLSNEGSSNSLDNTWGNYTIQEGESDLFLINNRNGKKYKFNLTEVS